MCYGALCAVCVLRFVRAVRVCVSVWQESESSVKLYNEAASTDKELKLYDVSFLLSLFPFLLLQRIFFRVLVLRWSMGWQDCMHGELLHGGAPKLALVEKVFADSAGWLAGRSTRSV